MANWSNPTLTSTYTNFVTEVKDRDTDCATFLDGSTSTNLPTGAKRWNSTTNKFEKWSGTAWSDLTTTYAISISGNSATATSATLAGNVTGVVAVGNGGTGVTTSTGSGSVVLSTSPTFTTSASAPLVIGGTGTTSSLSLRSTSGVGATGADIIFQTGNNGATEVMRVLNSGNVGIGTVSPGAKLDVAGSINATGNATFGDATTDTVTVSGYMSVGGTPTASQGLRVTPSALTGTLQFGSVLTLSATSAATAGVEAARVQAATAAASFTTAYAAGLWARDAILGAGSTITNNYGIYVDDKTVGTNNYGLVCAVSSGTNKWNIYASGTANNYLAGKVLIGTTSFAAGQNSKQIQPDGILSSRSTTGGDGHILFYNPNGLVGQIATSGAATQFLTTSDHRLKENVTPIAGALAKVAALKPVSYTWKVDGSDGEGFIAHELQEVCPLAVTGEKDAVNEDGKPVHQGIDPSKIIGLLTAAIQELKSELDALKACLPATPAASPPSP